MEQEFPRSFDELDRIFEFTRRFFAAEGIEDRHRSYVDLAVEEIFTNLVKYQTGTDRSVPVRLERDGEILRITLEDRGGERFDPTRRPEVDVEAPIERRRPGGLGIHLTLKVMDEVRYAYADGTGTIVMTRRLE